MEALTYHDLEVLRLSICAERRSDPRSERGFALVFALMIMFVLAVGGSSVIVFSVANRHSADRSNAGASALSLAQAGIDNAVSQLQRAMSENCNASYCAIIDPNWAPLAGGTTVTYQNGSVTYQGALQLTSGDVPIDPVWTITSTGSVRNPASSGSTPPLTKTMRADVRLRANINQVLASDAWKYIYSWRTGNVCDETIYNGSAVQASMYVSGNLCINNPASIAGPQVASDPAVNLIVRGTVNLDSSASIGSPAHPLSSVHIGQGCKFMGEFKQAICYKTADRWSNVYNGDTSLGPNPNMQSDTVLPPLISPPRADFVDWYRLAQPGPMHACQYRVGTPPVFDSDTTNSYLTGGSIPAVINLTPAAPYDCWTSGGELAWLPANTDPPVSPFPKGAAEPFSRRSYGQLYMNGTVYVDGSATVQYRPVRTSGNGVLYTSGTFLLKNSVLCAFLAADLNSCDARAYEASDQRSIFMVAANGNGGAGGVQAQVAAGDSVEVKSSQAQGAIYGSNVVEVDTFSQFQGPIVAAAETISQSGGSPFPAFPTVPFGTPGNPIIGFAIESVSNYR